MPRKGGWVVVFDEDPSGRRRAFQICLRTLLVGSDLDADIRVGAVGFPQFAGGFRLEYGRPWFHRFAGRAQSNGASVDSLELSDGYDVTIEGKRFTVAKGVVHSHLRESALTAKHRPAIEDSVSRALH